MLLSEAWSKKSRLKLPDSHLENAGLAKLDDVGLCNFLATMILREVVQCPGSQQCLHQHPHGRIDVGQLK